MDEGGGAYFERTGERRYRPTRHVGGAWSVTEQHISPMNGLVVHEVERLVAHRGDDDGKALARIGVDILGVLPMDEFELHLEVLRPGRTIELLEATVVTGDRAAVRTRIWRLARYDTDVVAGGAPDPLPPPDGLARWPLDTVWPGGYIASLDVRPLGQAAPGRTTAWIATDVELVADEEASDLARFCALIDTANGIAVRQPTDEWLFPNIEMTVHLHRQPVGRTVGLDTTVIFGPGGQGLTSSVLHDQQGPVGTAEQLLTIRPR